MSYRTLAELEADLRFKYDLEGFTARHPQTNVFHLLNDAYRDIRDRLTSDGVHVFVTSTEATQSTTGRTVGYPGTLLTVATFAGFQTVLDVHYLRGNSWIPLRHAALMDALTYSDNSVGGDPLSWSLAGVDAETGAGSGQSLQVLISPPLTAARTFRIVGVKSWTYLSTSTDRIYVDLGIDKYLLAAVGLVIATRDDDVALYGARAQEVEAAYSDVKKRSSRRAPVATRRIDVRRRRR